LVHKGIVIIKPMKTRPRPLAVLFALTLTLAAPACTYRAGYEDNPVTRSFAWFSYLNADDLRKTCQPGGSDRYRLVYNGVWQEQVRTYDITAGPGRRDFDFKAQVRGETDFARPIPLDDVLAPWRPQTVRKRIGRTELARLRGALRQSGFYTPVPQGTRVRSWGFFWAAASCEGGRFRFNAWSFPSKRFGSVRLARVLGALDGTGVPFNRPRDTWRPDWDEQRHVDRYELVVRGNGFADNLKLF
jgi:hypothetical protein